MKNKKLVLALFALVMVFALAACGGNDATSSEAPAASSVEESAASTESTAVEESTEVSEEPTANTAAIVKAGLGVDVSLASSKPATDGKATAQQNVTFAVVGLDAEGKIADVKIDVAQDKVPVTDGVVEAPAEYKTKKELGADYGMVGASGIGKEWFEQIAAVEDYMIGKTPEEVAATPLDESGVTTDADLLTGATVKLNGYLAAVANAVENATDVTTEAVSVGAQANTALGHSTVDATADAGAAVQFETTMVGVALDAEGKVAWAYTDVAQNTVAFNADGTLSTDVSVPGTTKQALGAEYGMVGASSIGKEWNEQADAFSAWTVGKTADEISALPVEEGKTTDADLMSSVTVTISKWVATAAEAVQNASK